VQRLQELHLPSTASEPVILLNSMDPANLFGPFELPGPERTLTRRPANWLALRAGRVVLVADQHASRVAVSPGASEDEIAQATRLLSSILRHHGQELRHKLTVQEWNGQPVTSSAGRSFLEAAGFVSDYRCMTLYAR
jgi:hypothetical protein